MSVLCRRYFARARAREEGGAGAHVLTMWTTILGELA